MGSRLSYMTFGTVPLQPRDKVHENSLVLLLTEAAPDIADDFFDLERFWKLEEVSACDKMSIQAKEDQKAVSMFKNSVRWSL